MRVSYADNGHALAAEMVQIDEVLSSHHSHAYDAVLHLIISRHDFVSCFLARSQLLLFYLSFDP